MKYEITIDSVRTSTRGFVINWSDKKYGFGQLSFSRFGEAKGLDTECMGEEFCNAVFAAFTRKFIRPDYQDNPACATCRWWGKKNHLMVLDTDDYNQIQIEHEFDGNKKRCLEISKQFGIEALYVDYEFEKTQDGNIYTPANFQCHCYNKTFTFHHYLDYLRGLCEIFQRKCNLKLHYHELSIGINGKFSEIHREDMIFFKEEGKETIVFKDSKDKPVLYDISEDCFPNEKCGKDRIEAVEWLLSKTPTFEQFKKGGYAPLETLIKS